MLLFVWLVCFRCVFFCFALKKSRETFWLFFPTTTYRLLMCPTGFYGSGHVLSHAYQCRSHSSNPAVEFNLWTCKENWYLYLLGRISHETHSEHLCLLEHSLLVCRMHSCGRSSHVCIDEDSSPCVGGHTFLCSLDLLALS